jgi:hypothetical protein
MGGGQSDASVAVCKASGSNLQYHAFAGLDTSCLRYGAMGKGGKAWLELSWLHLLIAASQPSPSLDQHRR